MARVVLDTERYQVAELTTELKKTEDADALILHLTNGPASTAMCRSASRWRSLGDVRESDGAANVSTC